MVWGKAELLVNSRRVDSITIPYLPPHHEKRMKVRFLRRLVENQSINGHLNVRSREWCVTPLMGRTTLADSTRLRRLRQVNSKQFTVLPHFIFSISFMENLQVFTRKEILEKEIIQTKNNVLSWEIQNKYLAQKMLVGKANHQFMLEVAKAQGQLKANQEFLKFLEIELVEENKNPSPVDGEVVA
jgi:hypothetical protein